MEVENSQPRRRSRKSAGHPASADEAMISQHAHFLETARALGCDEDEAAFDEKLKAVVGPKANDANVQGTSTKRGDKPTT